jgi:hypothetical protein
MKKYIKCNSTNGKELVTVNYGGDLCAVYKEEYEYGGYTALFMWDLTTDEFWGDVSINLPGGYSLEPNEIFLQDFIDSAGINYLKPILTVTDSVKCNYGTYKLAEIKPDVFKKLPNMEELEVLLQEHPEIIEEAHAMADYDEDEEY